MASISVRCDGHPDEGWMCHVTLREGGLDISTHRVRVWAADLSRFVPGATEPRPSPMTWLCGPRRPAYWPSGVAARAEASSFMVW